MIQYEMTQYNTFNLQLCNSLLNKLKSGIKNSFEIKKSSFIECDQSFIDKAYLPCKLLLTDIQVSRTRKTFANDSSDDITLKNLTI